MSIRTAWRAGIESTLSDLYPPCVAKLLIGYMDNGTLFNGRKDGYDETTGMMYDGGKELPGRLSIAQNVHEYDDGRGGRTEICCDGDRFELPTDSCQWVNWFTNYQPLLSRTEYMRNVIISHITPDFIRDSGEQVYLNVNWPKQFAKQFDPRLMVDLGFDTSYPINKEAVVYTNSALRYCGPSDATYSYYQAPSNYIHDRYKSTTRDDVWLNYSLIVPSIRVGKYILIPTRDDNIECSPHDIEFYDDYPDLWGYVVETNLQVKYATLTL